MNRYYHIVWVTHNSRVSERMITFKVSKGEPVLLSNTDETEIANYIFEISNEINIDICSINVCKDHIHMLINVYNKEIPKIMKTIKGKTTHLYKKNHNITHNYSLWAQKYFSEKIKDESYFMNVVEYIENNRNKHELPKNLELERVIYKYQQGKSIHQQGASYHQQGVATPCSDAEHLMVEEKLRLNLEGTMINLIKNDEISDSKEIQGKDPKSAELQYKDFIKNIKNKIYSSQIKATISVNKEMLMLYWNIAEMIVEKQEKSSWGSGFINETSKDLKKESPDMKGFSKRNLLYMKKWYLYWNEFVQQAVAQLETKNIFQIPWGHNILIIEKIKDINEAIFYINKTIENSWSRAVLVHQIESNFHLQGVETPCDEKLPAIQSDLAKQVLKDPYCFDFLTLTEDYNEREIESELGGDDE